MEQELNPLASTYRTSVEVKCGTKPVAATLLNTPFQQLLERYSGRWFLFTLARQCTWWGGVKWEVIVGGYLFSAWMGWSALAALIAFFSVGWLVVFTIRDLIAGPIVTTLRWFAHDLVRVNVTPLEMHVEWMKWPGGSPRRRISRVLDLKARLRERNANDLANEESYRAYIKLLDGHDDFVRYAGTVYDGHLYSGRSQGTRHGYPAPMRERWSTTGSFQGAVHRINVLLEQYEEAVAQRSGMIPSEDQTSLEESIRLSLAEAIEKLQLSYAGAKRYVFTSEGKEDSQPPSVN